MSSWEMTEHLQNHLKLFLLASQAFIHRPAKAVSSEAGTASWCGPKAVLPPEFHFGEKEPWPLSVFGALQLSDGITVLDDLFPPFPLTSYTRGKPVRVEG